MNDKVCYVHVIYCAKEMFGLCMSKDLENVLEWLIVNCMNVLGMDCLNCD